VSLALGLGAEPVEQPVSSAMVAVMARIPETGFILAIVDT
jgi:hypothetical protein